MEPIVGIDLGTTNSALAHLTPDGPTIIPNSLGFRLTPSVVGLDDQDTLLVGSAARELRVLHPERCVSLFKRYMGTDHEVTLGKRKFKPEELSSLILQSLKADAEAHFQKPVSRAVITVPAYFNDHQRQATIAAGRMAGLTVERILNEPTAAAIAYGFHETAQNKTMLVFDLGGGTFDVSVVDVFEGSLEVRASAGETWLGGEDFTRVLAARILTEEGTSFERAEATLPLLVSRLIQQCEWAKCKLSQDEQVTIGIPDAHGDLQKGKEFTITRQQMQEWLAPSLARLDAPLRRVLMDAKLTREQIHDIILVGGATRMPLIVGRVQELFGKTPHSRLNPDEVVALGAAVQAGLFARDAAVDDMVITDVSPFTLGIEISKEFSGEPRQGYFDPIIERNKTIPVSRSKTYSTVFPGQSSIVVKVYQGESRKVSDNLLLGQFEVKGIPHGAAGQPVEIRFTYDLNGVLEVEATIPATKRTISHVITKHARGFSEAQIREAIKQMAKLKTHPREEAVNRFLLARAERVYKELSDDHRRALSSLLDAFEMSLSEQDPAKIATVREELEEFLNYYDPSSESEGEERP